MTPAKRFAEMKDSGIEWVGMIPAHWHIKVLFQLVSQVKNKNKDLSETNLLSLSYGKIKRKNIDDTEGLLPASFDSYNIIENNDIVLRLTDLQNDHTSLRVGRATERGIITSAYITIRPTNSRMSEYLYYLLHSFDIKKGFYGMGSGVRQGLNYDEVKMLKLPLPPLNEESAIAAYLDTQCAKIDEIIAQAKASIEDYKQWKASIICEAVTKGLDPNVEMKDSGIEWIGRMPVHWACQKVCRCFDVIGSGTTPKSLDDDYYSGKIPWLQSGDINGWYVEETSKHITTEALNTFSALKIYEAPFIAVAMYGASIANTSIVYLDACTNQACCVLSNPAEKIEFEYIFYAILASKEELLLSARGGTQPNISQEIIKQLKLPIPPQKEQQRIITYLHKKVTEIGRLVGEKQTLIDDLESYKKSLIYEVVTGKRRVY